MLRNKYFACGAPTSPWLLTISLLMTAAYCGGELSNANNNNSSLLLVVGKSRKLLPISAAAAAAAETPKSSTGSEPLPPDGNNEWIYWLFPVVAVGLFGFYIYVVGKKAAKLARDREMLRALSESPPLKRAGAAGERAKQEPEEVDDEGVELVFFVDEEEAFQLEDLFGAEADLQNQTHCSSLYKVTLKNQVVYVVKRLKKLQVPFDEFGRTMRQIGNTKHPNILPLVAYSSTHDEKLMIYHYQNNGSLLNLLDDYIEGKKEFPWRWRLVIAGGIARGLDMIHQSGNVHGNLKPSNILLDSNMEAVISEYGFARFFREDENNAQKCCPNNGYTAPERSLSESSSDVYSFGVILLELLTGKTIEKTGMDLPKWVKSMVSEEWTGEVFDKEVSKAAKMWGAGMFSLLKLGLMCVSDDPHHRPSICEVLDKIEQVINDAQQLHLPFSPSSSSHQHSSASLLHTVIPENISDDDNDTPHNN